MKIYFLTILCLYVMGCSNDDNYPGPDKVIDPIAVDLDEGEAGEEEENETPAFNDTLTFTYLALGDSYTIGQNVAVEERWPIQLITQLQENGFHVDTVDVVAQTGWTTNNLMSAIEGRNFDQTFDLVSLLIGVNNQYQGRSITEYAQEFESLLNTAIILADGNKDKVFVLSIPDYSVTPFASHSDTEKIARELQEFNAKCKEITINAGVAYFDITPLSLKAENDPSLLADDDLHPSGKMYREWVDLIYDDIVELINN